MSRCSSRLKVLFILLWLVLLPADAFLDRKKKKRKEAELASHKAAKDATQKSRSNNVGDEFEKMKSHIVGTGAVLVFLAAGIFLNMEKKKKKWGNNNEEGTLDVVIVGCGLPKKGMGWFHLTQLLEMKNANVRAIVEPFFLNEKLCKEVPPLFSELVTHLDELGVECVASVDDLKSFSRPTMCLIAGRTHDNPELFRQCVRKGASVIYLEKPGAPSVDDLQQMKELAERNNVKTYIGYNKNVTPYVQKAVELSKQVENSHVFFCHNNSYSQADLPEVFARNSEGLLKNMVIHELAVLVTFFGVTVDSIDKFKVNTNKLFSEKISIWKPGTSMPNPVYITDFSRAAFKITTKDGKNVSVMADRCGGNISFAVVKDAQGNELAKFEFPDAEAAKKLEEQVKADPQMMPYFFIQSKDYLELKERVVDSILAGRDAEGVATITIAIEALKLAEYGTEQLNKALKLT